MDFVSFRGMDLSSCVGYAIQILEEMKETLVMVDLCNCSIDTKILESLFLVLRSLPKLVALDLSKNPFDLPDEPSSVDFSKLVQLKALNISDCLVDEDFGDVLIDQLSCLRLRHLNLNKCKMEEGDDMLLAFCNFISNSKHISTVYFGNGKDGSDSTEPPIAGSSFSNQVIKANFFKQFS